MLKDACDICDLNSTAELKKMGESQGKEDFTIALAGNPNTGKSTVFNALTGLKQHTGNWPGKTVTRAEGSFSYHDNRYKIIDLPGTYSLLSTSDDEEVARDYILFGHPDVTIIVVDASRLERNLSLVLQILQITPKAVLCLNLMDEARRHRIEIDSRSLARDLGIPVVETSARRKEGIQNLLNAVHLVATGKVRVQPKHFLKLSPKAEQSCHTIEKALMDLDENFPSPQWVALRLLSNDESIKTGLVTGVLSNKITEEQAYLILAQATAAQKNLEEDFTTRLAENIYAKAAKIVESTVQSDHNQRSFRVDRKIDQIVTSRFWGFPIMLLLLGVILWLTIAGANWPSSMLSNLLLETVYPQLKTGAVNIGMPAWMSGFLIDGVYMATAWVIAVMLPPMAIFFPLFTLLEDFGYLPRVAFNLDRIFQKAGAHGKQALTMSMGFGCNAAGVVSTRIINSPREKLIAIITNNFSLCNGRWPTQILIATIFIGAMVSKPWSSTIATFSVIGIVLLGIGFSFFTSWLLSKTMLKGESSFFTLELPPYRPPQFWQTIYTSLIDRTLIVLWRAVVFAAPAGAIIWLISNISIGDTSIAVHVIDFLNPFGLILGLNGVILLAYIVAIPANEIVIPTILMLSAMVLGDATIGEGAGVMFETSNAEIKWILVATGWTTLTAINLMLFSLLHNPCSTTIYTIYKETNSTKWTIVASILPVIYGIIVCFIIAQLWYLFN